MSTKQAVIDVRLLDQPVVYLPIEDFPQPAGAECVFLGRTRIETHNTHGKLMRLDYKAYAPLAESTLRNLAEQAAREYSCLFVRVHHAIGEVPPGQASVLVQVVCGHRGKSFEACRWLIDTLKKQAPIWKHERWERGETWAEGTPVSMTTDDSYE